MNIIKAFILALTTLISPVDKVNNSIIVTSNGDIPVLLSAPHGGAYKPKTLKDRKGVNFKTSEDTYTIEIMKGIEKELILIYGKPFTVFSNLHRSKLDFNREIQEATDTCVALYPLYNKYQNFIENTILNSNKTVLVIDIHGHNHKEELIELGYGGNIPKSKLYYGDNSFGAIFNKFYGKNICYPPYPKKPKKYFNGGYITEKQYKNEFHIQIEIPKKIRVKERTLVAKLLAKTIKEFYELNLK